MRLVLVNGALLALIGLAIGGLGVLDRADASVEGSVRRYARAISQSDLNAAMAEIALDRRAAWVEFVRGQLGDVYEIKGIAVRSPSVMQRVFAHRPGGPFEVTAVLDINRGYPDEFYQPTTRVPVAQVDNHWYLVVPLLVKTEDGRST